MARRRRLAWWALLAAASLALAGPLALVDIPPLLDYPNHLARYLILARPDDPVLSRFWEPSWAVLPNLAADLVVPPLARLLPLDLAGRLVLGAALLLTLGAMVVHHRVAFGRRSWWPLAGALVACHGLFLFGFLNFSIGLGVALRVSALWIATRERRPALAIAGGAAGVALAFFCHASAVLFCAALLGGQEAAAVLRAGRGAWIREALRRGAALAAVLAPAILLSAASPLAEATGPTIWASSVGKGPELLLAFSGYRGVLDLAAVAAVAGVLALAAARRTLGVHPGSLVAAAGLMAAFLILPHAAKGAAFIDARFPVMVGLLLFAGLDPRLPRRAALVAGAALASLVALRTGAVAQAWTAHRQDLAAVRAAVASVEPGSRVLVATGRSSATRAYWAHGPRSRVVTRLGATSDHLGALAVIERRAFVPLVFAIHGQQPIQVRAPFDRIAVPSGYPVDHRLLARSSWSERELANAPYLPGWRDGFDYVLLLEADAPAELHLPPDLEEVRDAGYAALFRIAPRNAASASYRDGGASTLSR